MAVTHQDIAKRLGVATPDPASTTAGQWDTWIGDAEYLIDARAARLERTVDPDVRDRVVALAVVEMARNPNNETQVDVAVDDGRVSRRFSSSQGRVGITDEWWTWLGLLGEPGAFSTRPGFVPDYIWPLP